MEKNDGSLNLRHSPGSLAFTERNSLLCICPSSTTFMTGLVQQNAKKYTIPDTRYKMGRAGEVHYSDMKS